MSNTQAQKTQEVINDWSLEAAFGVEFYRDFFSNSRDKGFEYLLKVENYSINHFGLHASASFEVSDDYYTDLYNGDNINYGSLKESSNYSYLNLGGSWYVYRLIAQRISHHFWDLNFRYLDLLTK